MEKAETHLLSLELEKTAYNVNEALSSPITLPHKNLHLTVNQHPN